MWQWVVAAQSGAQAPFKKKGGRTAFAKQGAAPVGVGT